jgi:predicted dienelactone hydrolase
MQQQMSKSAIHNWKTPMKMNLRKFLVGCASALAMIGFCQAAEVGVANFTFNATHRNLPVQALIWYPASPGRITESVGKDAVFQGVDVFRNAKPEQGKHPLVILSHGAGGNAANLGWLSAKLVAQGYIVAVPNHPGSTSGDSAPETNAKAWERPLDMTALLSALETANGWQRLIDQSDITAMGFSMGGYTALALGGARVEKETFAKYCDDNKAAEDCVWYDRGNSFIKGHVDLHSVDAKSFEGNYADARITRVVAIDPAIAQAFNAESLRDMKKPTLVLNLGSDGTVPLGVDGKEIANKIPGAALAKVSGANHFTFIGTCKTFGWFFLLFDGDDPICTEVSDRRRVDMHDEIASKIITFLKGKNS